MHTKYALFSQNTVQVPGTLLGSIFSLSLLDCVKRELARIFAKLNVTAKAVCHLVQTVSSVLSVFGLTVSQRLESNGPREDERKDILAARHNRRNLLREPAVAIIPC